VLLLLALTPIHDLESIFQSVVAVTTNRPLDQALVALERQAMHTARKEGIELANHENICGGSVCNPKTQRYHLAFSGYGYVLPSFVTVIVLSDRHKLGVHSCRRCRRLKIGLEWLVLLRHSIEMLKRIAVPAVPLPSISQKDRQLLNFQQYMHSLPLT